MFPSLVDTALAVNMTLAMSDSRNQETQISNLGWKSGSVEVRLSTCVDRGEE